ncbi:hypothetical protein [Sporosarcina newyorkensis]|uniref:hypothetical protein n=1 Tax=Sporosarcina newyorkensis TaxID=759851 RepID=UPI00149501B8|nr:hypothetical protein [Sporosarcina newyorkensis]
MKKGSVGMIIFTCIFVILIMLLFEFLIPTTRIIRVIIAGLSALVGGLIGNKLFPNKE